MLEDLERERRLKDEYGDTGQQSILICRWLLGAVFAMFSLAVLLAILRS